MSASPALNRSRTTRDSGPHLCPFVQGYVLPALHALWMASAARCKRNATDRGLEVPGPRSAKNTNGADPRTHGDRFGRGIAPRDEEHPEGCSDSAHRTTSDNGDRGDGRFRTRRRNGERAEKGGQNSGQGRATSCRSDTKHPSASRARSHEQTGSDVHGLMRTSAPRRRSIAVNWARLGLPEGPTYIQLLCTAQPTRDSAASSTHEYRQTHWAAGSRAISPASRAVLTCT